jgi:phosphatidylserine/phosphatidylglycerophosphate/cardiolipin synthase-like enzyme
MSSTTEAALSGRRRQQVDSPYLSDWAVSAARRDGCPSRIGELAAISPFMQPSEERESWIGDWPARVLQALCTPFLSADASTDYEKYLAAPTTGRMTPFINGRYWGGVKPKEDQFDAFNAMQAAVEGLQSGDSLFLAAWMFDPTLALTRTSSLGSKNWGDLFQRKASDGVKIRILVTDFSFIFKDQNDKLYKTFLPALNTLIAGLKAASRDNLKYVVSLHPATHMRVHVATHHQKFMVLKTRESTTAFCGGLDLAFMRTPAYWGKLDATTYRWLWHDIHSRLEGLITSDLEREFVMRWNREKDHSVARSQPGWNAMETLVRSTPTTVDRSPQRNADQLQMLRTVSIQGAGASIQNTRRDDIWQGYQRLIGCAKQFLYMENQYFREPRMADAIVAQAKAQKELAVIVVVPSETDDLPDAGKLHGDSLQHEFFVRLTKGIPKSRLGVYTMFHRIIHAKFIMADDRALCLGSANANPRGFFLDSELNVMLDSADTVKAFRHRLWAHNLGVADITVAGWNSAAFIARWDAVASANEKLRSRPEKMTGEAVIKFDTPGPAGARQEFIDDVETEVLDVRS